MPRPPGAAPVPVVLDVDAREDDLVAVAVAAGHPDLDLRAVTVTGALPDDETGAERVRALLGAIRGRSGTGPELLRPEDAGEQVAGTGAAGLARALQQVPRNAADRSPARAGGCVLVVTGPLTSAAEVAVSKPDLLSRVRRLVWMGGVLGPGVVGTRGGRVWEQPRPGGGRLPDVETNARADPRAVRTVLCGVPGARGVGPVVPATVCGLDATFGALVDDGVVDRIRGTARDAAHAKLLDRLVAFALAHETRYRRDAGLAHPPLHDAVAVVAAARPEVLRTVPGGVRVQVEGPRAGRLHLGTAGPGAVPVHVATGVDTTLLWDHVVLALARLGGGPR
ncbi:nucleoside hydrolase [Thalassiella azotivora]